MKYAFTLTIEGLMSLLYLHEQQMNRNKERKKIIKSINSKQEKQSRAYIGGCDYEQSSRGCGRGKREHNNSTNRAWNDDENSYGGRGNTNGFKDKL